MLHFAGVSNFTEQSVIYADFVKLPMVQRVYALHLACRNLNQTRILFSYANELFGKFREHIRSFPFDDASLSEPAQEIYFCVKKAYTFEGLVRALTKLDDDSERDRDLERSIIISRLGGDLVGTSESNTPDSPRKKASSKELNKIFELVEDVLKKSFEDCPWTEVLQAEAGSLKQSAEYSQMLDYLGQVLHYARFLPLRQMVTGTISMLTTLLPSGGSDSITAESVMKLIGK